MSEQKHTPGPWRILNEWSPETVGTEDGATVANTCFGRSWQGKANAARIVECVNACEGLADPSAVPDLLAACENLLTAWDTATTGYDGLTAASEDRIELAANHVRAAIRKATGGT